MRIKDLQLSFRERCRIRLGYSTLNQRGKKIPHKLDKFRFTCPDRETADQLAGRYGGKVEPWPDGGKDRFQLVGAVDSLDVLYASGLGLWQAYEQYDGPFAVVRCDGQRAMAPGSNGRMIDEGPCTCDPTERSCVTTTSLSVLLAGMAGFGTARLVTHSYWAAVRIAAAVEVIERAMPTGAWVPCRLFITTEETKRLVGGKPETHRYIVPNLDLNMTVAALAGGAGYGGTGGAGESQGGPNALGPDSPAALPPSWRPVDQDALPAAPPVTVAGQMAEAAKPPPRTGRSAPPMPATGKRPRSAQQAKAGTICSFCNQPYDTAPLVANPDPAGSRWAHRACVEAEEGEPVPDQPPAPAEDDGPRGRGGTDGTAAPPPGAEPTPAAGPGYVRVMTPKQHKMSMALAADIWPAVEGESSGDTDARRREQLLWLAAVLGQPGLESRKDIAASTATLLLDALKDIKDGALDLTAAGLIDTASGEIAATAP